MAAPYSSSLGKRPSAQRLPLPVSTSELADATRPALAAQSTTQQLIHCLQQDQATTDGVVDCLVALRDANIRTLDLSGQTLSATAVARLAQAFRDWPRLLSHFTGFDFSGARLDILWPLLEVLKDRQGEAIAFLKVWDARVLSSDEPNVRSYGPLQEDDLQRIAAIMAQQRDTLNEAPPQKTTETAVQTLVHCLRQGDTPGVIECLSQASNHTLDLSRQTLDAQVIDALVRVLREHPDLLGPLHTIDLSDALVMQGCLQPLLELLMKQHPGPGLQGLYLAGTRVLGRAMAESMQRPLNKHEWREIAGLVRQCPSLIELVLDRQPGLSGQMETLALALGASAVQHLSLRACNLGLKDLADLDALAMRAREQFREHRRAGSGLGFIDLTGNEGLFKDTARLEAGQTPHGVMTQLAVHLRDNKSLQFLHLPEQAVEAFCDHEESALALTLLLDPWICPRQLQQLEPFSSASDELVQRLAVPQQRVMQLFKSGEASEARDRLAAIAGQWMLRCLRQYDAEAAVNGLIGGLGCMQAFGISTLDLSGSVLKANTAYRLARVLELQPGLMSALSAFDWHSTTLVGGLEPWLALLLRHVALGLGKVASLNLANTKSAAPADSGPLKVTGLSAEEFKGLAGLVQQHAALRELDLSHQESLLDQWALMARAIGASSVRKVVLWDCDLRLEHAQRLIVYARPLGQGLRVIDLWLNDRMFEGHQPQAVTALVKTALQNPDLQELWLPQQSESLFDTDWAVVGLWRVIIRSKQFNFVRLEPLSSSGREGLACLRELLTIDRAARAGQHVLRCLQRWDVPGAIKVLDGMRAVRIQTLNFSGQTLSVHSLACLKGLLHEQPDALSRRGITAFDFSEAQLEGSLVPWLKVLERHVDPNMPVSSFGYFFGYQFRSGIIKSLNLSFTEILTGDGSRELTCRPLSTVDIDGLFRFVMQCPTLRELQLNGQPGLRGHLRGLTEALPGSSVQHLGLRACGLGLPDLEKLSWHVLVTHEDAVPGCGLSCIDLRDNNDLLTQPDGLTSSQVVGEVLADFVEHLIGYRSLQSLHLPTDAIEAFFAHDEVAWGLMLLLDPSLCSRQLRLEPFSSAGAELAERFSALKQRVSKLFAQGDLREQLPEQVLMQRERLAAINGRCVGFCLQRLNASDLMGNLHLMQDLGIKARLDLRDLLCSAESAVLLSKLLEQQPGLMTGTIIGFDFHAAKLEEGSLETWLTVLQRHLAQGGVIESLDFGDTRIGAPNGRCDLSTAELDGIAELMAQCTALRKLNLTGQKSLSGHMDRMAQAIAAGSVQTVKFMDCGLRLEDAQSLVSCALQRSPGNGLRVIDLLSNDKIFTDANARQVISLVTSALQNPDLQMLHLASEAGEWLDNKQVAAELMQVLEQSGHAKLIGLWPFSSPTSSAHFAPLKRFLKANAERPPT